MSPLDDHVARTAARHHGLFRRADVLGAGGDDALIARRVAAERWRRVARGVLLLYGAPFTWQTRLLAAVWGAGPGAVAAHRSAARLWGLDGFRASVPELTVPVARRATSRGCRRHRSTDLERARCVVLQGIPTTGLARTILDLGAIVDADRLELAADDAIITRQLSWDDLVEALVDHGRPGRNGVGPLRTLLAERVGDEVPGSRLNRLGLRVLLGAGLPPPSVEFPVDVDAASYRIDLAYPAQRLAIECDGSVHLRRAVFERDLARQNALVLAGWTVLRFPWAAVIGEPDRVVAEVCSALSLPPGSARS